MTKPEFTFVDLFAGIGGMRLAFDSVGGQCVATIEKDRFARQTYRANFAEAPGHMFAGDVAELDATEIPDHDLLLAGFPCQPFSIAGVSKKNSLNRPHGFDDPTQGTLFFDVKRILAAKRPRALLLENVKNLLSHDKGRTFRTILSVLESDLGYRVSYRVIDGKCFTPQHRERLFIVGFRDSDGFDLNSMSLPPTGQHTVGEILHKIGDTPLAHDSGRFCGTDGRALEKFTLTDHFWGYLQDYAAKHKAAGNGFGYGLVSPDKTTRSLLARYYKDGSEILIDQPDVGRPRRLTPRECARLMGFGNDFRIPVSNTQAYKQFGNSVVVPAVTAIAQYMAPYLRIEDASFPETLHSP